jgi:hypothetical protein
MWRFCVVVTGFISLSLNTCGTGAQDSHVSGMSYTSFVVDGSPIVNPERGFYKFRSTDDIEAIANVRSQGYALARLYVRLDPFISSDIPESFLRHLSRSFAIARRVGIKIIIHMTYNNGYIDNNILENSKVATLAQILRHIAQIKPILQSNEDTILCEEAGYIGAWGEWHHSNTIADTDTTSRAAVLNAMLDALPKSRMVLVRYPIDLYRIHGAPTTAEEAYSGTNRARVGFYNLAFATSADDWSTFTYWGVPGFTVAQNKNFIAANAKYTATGGESGSVSHPYSDCPASVADLKKMHYSYLDADFNAETYNLWKKEGCYDDVAKLLGYRFQLVDARYTSVARAGSRFELNLRVANVGYAAMFNVRPVYAILKNATKIYAFPLINADPRWWFSEQTTRVKSSFELPATMQSGTYSLYLWLPDPAATLQNDPRYAVRFANKGTWDGVTGYNQIARDITIR